MKHGRRWALVGVAAVAGFGIVYSTRRAAVLNNVQFVTVGTQPGDPLLADHVSQVLMDRGIPAAIDGSIIYGIAVPEADQYRAYRVLRSHVRQHRCGVTVYPSRPRTFFDKLLTWLGP
jgi:hypothetical protein